MTGPVSVPVEPPAEVRAWAQRLRQEFVALAHAGFLEHQALIVIVELAKADRKS